MDKWGKHYPKHSGKHDMDFVLEFTFAEDDDYGGYHGREMTTIFFAS